MKRDASMGLFSRKSNTADPHLPELSIKQADKLRAMSVAAVSRLGVSAVAAGDHLAVSEGSGNGYGLFAVGRKAAQLPESDWPGMVEQHFGSIIGGTSQSSELAVDEMLSRVYPKFISPGTLAHSQQIDPSRYGYARDVAMIPLLVALDSPESVTYVGAPEIETAGGEDIVWDAALKNLIAEGPGEPEAMNYEDGSFLVFETESVYQASWLAYPDRFFELLGYQPGPLGALLSIPATNILCLHLVTEATSITDISAMISVTGAMQAQHPSALSPLLYWWDGTTVQPITGHDGENVHLIVPDELASIL
ncbi:hypothetical protein M1E17_20645 [Arthrobacter sp. D1-29]